MAVSLATTPAQAAQARTDPDLRWMHGDERFQDLVRHGDG